VLFVGDDWARDHHDVELVDEDGKKPAAKRFPEGLAGVSGLHALIAAHLPAEWADLPPGEAAHRVKIGIESDHGVWVQALVAAGYEVFAINPLSAKHYRGRASTSGAKSDAADAHLLAEIVRLDRANHRPVAADSDQVEAIKLAARTHQGMIWERSRQVLRLRSTLVEFFPAALEAFPDLDEPDALELLAAAPDPDRAAWLPLSRISAALTRAQRRNVAERARRIQQLFRTSELRQTPALQATYAAVVTAQLQLVATLNEQVDALGLVVEQHFGRHPDADIYASLPGLGVILGARVLGEFGDAPDRYADARARKNAAGSSPITKASGKKRVVLARYAC
jgi:transposase